MLLIFFIIGVVLAAILLILGVKHYSFPMVYLSMFIFLLIGLFLLGEGIELETGTRMIPQPDGSTLVEPIYTAFTTNNNFIILIIANTFFYIPFAGILLSIFFALKHWGID